MAFTPRQIGVELDIANLQKHNDNLNDIKRELDAHDTHIASKTAHGSTAAATAGSIMQRDGAGRAKVAAPAVADDIARKDTVDAVQTEVNNHKNNADIHVTKAKKDEWDSKATGDHRHTNATAAADGFLSKEDKAKIDASTSNVIANTIAQRDAAGRIKVAAPVATDEAARKAEVDTVQLDVNNHKNNADIHVTKAKKDEWDSKAAGNHRHTNATTTADGFMSKEDKAQLAGIQAGAEANQNAFSTIKVAGQSDVKASNKTDALNIAGGIGITVTTNAANNNVMITATGTATPGKHASSHLEDGTDPIPVATASKSGLMAASDKSDLERIKKDIDRVDLSTPVMSGVNILATDMASMLEASFMGNTLVPVLGDLGTFKDLDGGGVADGWSKHTEGKYSMVDGYQRIESLASDTGISLRRVGRWSGMKLTAGKKYVCIVDCVTDGTATASLSFGGTGAAGNKQSIKNGPMFIKLAPTVDVNDNGIAMYNQSPLGQVGWVQFKDASLYEVDDDTIFNAIGTTINESNIRDYFPHVDGVKHVEGVLITKKGSNLLKPFTDDLFWKLPTSTLIKSPYSIDVNAGDTSLRFSSPQLPAIPGQKYTLSVGRELERNVLHLEFLKDGKYIYGAALAGSSVTGTVPQSANAVIVTFSNGSQINRTFSIEDIQLEIGDRKSGFVEYNEDQVVLPITLAKVGNVADRAYWRDGAWRKLKTVETGVSLDGTLPWVFAQSYSGYKRFRVDNYFYGVYLSERVIKYNGILLGKDSLNYASADASGLYNVNGIVNFNITIANSDSGFAQDYNPTNQELSATMNGWKVKTADANGKPTSWVSVLDGKDASTQTLAYVSANKAPNLTAWATLDYALAQPYEVKEPLSLAGLSLNKGMTQIEIETGVIYREQITFKKAADDYWYSNSTALSFESTLFKHRVKKIRKIEQGVQEAEWEVSTANPGSYGLERLKIADKHYDPKAEYFATYLSLDPISASVVAATATYTNGLSGVLSETVQMLADNMGQDQRQEQALNYIQAHTENNRVDLDAHIADLTSHVPFVAAAGSANTYTATISTPLTGYVDGIALAIKINIANTGASTINVNGWGAKSIKRSNGSDVLPGMLKVGLVYTVRYSAGNFILQGEGGEYGTATAAQVLETVTFGDENGVKQGTMPNRSTVSQTITTQGGEVPILVGYHSGNGKITAQFANLIAGNVKSGVNIGGIVGTLTPMLNKKGSISIPSKTEQYVELGFIPIAAGAKVATTFFDYGIFVKGFGSLRDSVRIDVRVDGTKFYIYNNSDTSNSYTYEAWG